MNIKHIKQFITVANGDERTLRNWKSFKHYLPGDVIRDEIKERKWVLRDVAFSLNMSVFDFELLLDGRKVMSDKTADQLGNLFNVAGVFFLKLYGVG